jgi:hypothetical protein
MYSNQPYFQNVQQINGTGHSIRAFMITAIAMCAAAVALWAFIAGFQSRRARLKKELTLDFMPFERWKWYDRLIMFRFRVRWKWLWPDPEWLWRDLKSLVPSLYHQIRRKIHELSLS